VAGHSGDVDVLAVALDGAYVCVHMVYVRGGRVIGNKHFHPRHQLLSDEAGLLSDFIAHFYLGEQGAQQIPADLIVSVGIEDADSLQQALSQCAGQRVRISHRVRGHRARWLEMALTNARLGLEGLINSRQQAQQRHLLLQQALGLDALPQRIECFDISHTSGESTTAACVVFDSNGPLKSDYRRFNISEVAAGDDYAAMEQALLRRFVPKALRQGRTEGEDQQAPMVLPRDELKIPDILLIDGGKGQLGRAAEVMAQCQLQDVLLMGIAKGISRRAGQETLLLVSWDGAGNHVFSELALPEVSPALHLLQQIRDEAHRFAITGHRQRRARSRRESPLEQIPGLGPKRRRALLTHFGGQQQLSRASEEEIARVSGISKKLAADVYAALHNE